MSKAHLSSGAVVLLGGREVVSHSICDLDLEGQSTENLIYC